MKKYATCLLVMALRCVELSTSITDIGYAAFSDCSALNAITVDGANPVYHSVDCLLPAMTFL